MLTIELLKAKIVFTEKNEIISGKIFNSRVFVICDTMTKKYCLPVFKSLFPELKYVSYVMPEGESSKSLKECEKLIQFYLSNNVNRTDIIVALGGGVVCDITGFTASVFKRGIRCIYFPTTLLAMVDAAIGGKNGIDYKGIKNIFGTFYDPEYIIIHSQFLKTLGNRHIESGMAEVIKTLLLSDGNDWSKYVKNNKIVVTTDLIKRCGEIKIGYVKNDYYDRNGRHALNLGHTLGHAIEAYSISKHPDPLLHGEAIAAGLLCELYLSFKLTGFSKIDLDNITSFIKENFRHVNSDCFKYENLKDYLKFDKKNSSPGVPSFTLLESFGKPVINQLCKPSLIKEALKYYQQVYKSKKGL